MNKPPRKKPLILRLLTAWMTLIVFAVNTAIPAQAQSLLNLPAAGVRVSVSPSYIPATLKGVRINPDNPFQFDFIVDRGDSLLAGDDFKSEANRLVRYFLASLTTPEADMWVNLSPYEKDRIIPESFGVTEMGRDLLAEDYMLKQITASIIYPEEDLGKKFWDKVHKEAYERFQTTDVPVDTFNKVWVVPDKAVVYEHEQTAFVTGTHLKVMLEQDYLALQKSADHGPHSKEDSSAVDSGLSTDVNALGSQIVREIVIPELEKEVNEGKNFAHLRQVYHSLILATWYKRKLKGSILNKIYVDQKKTSGVDIKDKEESQKIYAQYLDAFKKGVYNYIKEDFDEATQETIPRKYFSGGIEIMKVDEKLSVNQDDRAFLSVSKDWKSVMLGVSLLAAGGGDELAKKFNADQQAAARSLVASNQADQNRSLTDSAMLADRRQFISASLKTLALGAAALTLNGCAGLSRSMAIGSFHAEGVRSMNDVLEQTERQLSESERELMRAVSQQLEEALRRRQSLRDLNASLNDIIGGNPKIQAAFQRGRDAKSGKPVAVTKDPLFEYLIAKITQFGFDYGLQQMGVNVAAERQALLADIQQSTILGYWDADTDGAVKFINKEAVLGINVKHSYALGESFATAIHELMHFLAKDKNPAFGRFHLKPTDDVTWLLASAMSEFYTTRMTSRLPQRVNEAIYRRDTSPQDKHALIRQLPVNLASADWAQNVRAVEAVKTPKGRIKEPPDSYREGRMLAAYALHFSGAGDVIMRLYATRHDLNFAQLDAAAGILNYLLESFRFNVPQSEIETAIVEDADFLGIAPNISFSDLNPKVEALSSKIAEQLKSENKIQFKAERKLSPAADRAMMGEGRQKFEMGLTLVAIDAINSSAAEDLCGGHSCGVVNLLRKKGEDGRIYRIGREHYYVVTQDATPYVIDAFPQGAAIDPRRVKGNVGGGDYVVAPLSSVADLYNGSPISANEEAVLRAVTGYDRAMLTPDAEFVAAARDVFKTLPADAQTVKIYGSPEFGVSTRIFTQDYRMTFLSSRQIPREDAQRLLDRGHVGYANNLFFFVLAKNRPEQEAGQPGADQAALASGDDRVNAGRQRAAAREALKKYAQDQLQTIRWDEHLSKLQFDVLLNDNPAQAVEELMKLLGVSLESRQEVVTRVLDAVIPLLIAQDRRAEAAVILGNYEREFAFAEEPLTVDANVFMDFRRLNNDRPGELSMIFTPGDRRPASEMLAHFDLFQSMKNGPASLIELSQFVERSLKIALRSEAWNPVRDAFNNDAVVAAIWTLMERRGQDMKYLDFDKLKNELYLRQSDGRLFMKKEPGVLHIEGDTSEGYHLDQNNPVRDLVATRVGEAVGANVAETVSEPGAVYSAVYLPFDNISNFKSRLKAEAVQFVYAVYLRKVDETLEMINRVPVGGTFASIDQDQTMSMDNLNNWPRFVQLFVQHFSHEGERWHPTREQERMIREAVDGVRRLNIFALTERIKREDLGAFGADRDAALEIDRLATFLEQSKKTIEGDTEKLFEAATGRQLRTTSELQTAVDISALPGQALEFVEFTRTLLKSLRTNLTLPFNELESRSQDLSDLMRYHAQAANLSGESSAMLEEFNEAVGQIDAGLSIIVGNRAALDDAEITGLVQRGLDALEAAAKKFGNDQAMMGLQNFENKILLNGSTGRIQLTDQPAVLLDFELWGVRHGQTFGNITEGMFQGALNEDVNQLTPRGKEQAEKAAKALFGQLRLKIEAGEKLVIITSMLNRSRDTGAAFIRLLDQAGAAYELADDDIKRGANEINFGIWDNKTEQDFAGEELTRIQRYRKGLDATIRAQNGESFIDLMTRIKDWTAKLNERFKGRTVVLFGHGTHMAALRTLLGDQRMADADGYVDWRANMMPNAAPVLLSNPDRAALADDAGTPLQKKIDYIFEQANTEGGEMSEEDIRSQLSEKEINSLYSLRQTEAAGELMRLIQSEDWRRFRQGLEVAANISALGELTGQGSAFVDVAFGEAYKSSQKLPVRTRKKWVEFVQRYAHEDQVIVAQKIEKLKQTMQIDAVKKVFEQFPLLEWEPEFWQMALDQDETFFRPATIDHLYHGSPWDGVEKVIFENNGNMDEGGETYFSFRYDTAAHYAADEAGTSKGIVLEFDFRDLLDMDFPFDFGGRNESEFTQMVTQRPVPLSYLTPKSKREVFEKFKSDDPARNETLANALRFDFAADVSFDQAMLALNSRREFLRLAGMAAIAAAADVFQLNAAVPRSGKRSLQIYGHAHIDMGSNSDVVSLFDLYGDSNRMVLPDEPATIKEEVANIFSNADAREALKRYQSDVEELRQAAKRNPRAIVGIEGSPEGIDLVTATAKNQKLRSLLRKAGVTQSQINDLFLLYLGPALYLKYFGGSEKLKVVGLDSGKLLGEMMQLFEKFNRALVVLVKYDTSIESDLDRIAQRAKDKNYVGGPQDLYKELLDQRQGKPKFLNADAQVQAEIDGAFKNAYEAVAGMGQNIKDRDQHFFQESEKILKEDDLIVIFGRVHAEPLLQRFKNRNDVDAAKKILSQLSLESGEARDAAMVGISQERLKGYQDDYQRLITGENPLLSFEDFILDRMFWESLGRTEVDRVIYGGAGADLSNVLMSTRAKTVFMVSKDNVTVDQLRDYISAHWDDAAGLKKQNQYASFKRDMSWAPGDALENAFDISSGIVAELKSLGLGREDISFGLTPDGKNDALIFDLDAGNGVKEKRYIVFMQKDLAAQEITIEGGVDGYYERASMDALDDQRAGFTAKMVKNIRPGGFMAFNKVYPRVTDAEVLKNNFTQVLPYQGSEAWIRQLERQRASPPGYGWRMTVYTNYQPGQGPDASTLASVDSLEEDYRLALMNLTQDLTQGRLRELPEPDMDAVVDTLRMRLKQMPVDTDYHFKIDAAHSYSFGKNWSKDLYRLGPFIFITSYGSPEVRNGFSADTIPGLVEDYKNSLGDLYGQFAGNIIFTAPYSAVARASVNSYTASIIALMLDRRGSFEGATVVDFGAGAGILSMVALRLGAKKAVLLEKDPSEISLARALLTVQGWKEGEDFVIENQDFQDAGGSLKEILKDSAKTVGLINIGPWKNYGDANNLALKMAQDFNLIIDGGFVDGKDQFGVDHREALGQTRSLLTENGYSVQKFAFKPDPDVLQGVQLLVAQRTSDPAMLHRDEERVGGIDFNADKIDLEVNSDGAPINFRFDPAQFENMKVDGFTPVIINMTPIADLPQFIGLTEASPPDQLARVTQT